MESDNGCSIALASQQDSQVDHDREARIFSICAIRSLLHRHLARFRHRT